MVRNLVIYQRKGANNLVNSKSSNTLTKTRTNGDSVFYNTKTNEFAVKTADGYIKTYFKPSGGINYFNRQ